MKIIPLIVTFAMLGALGGQADAGQVQSRPVMTCNESGCGVRNLNQVYQREQALRAHNAQSQMRICQNIQASGRVALPAACR